jgi:hypothetical protein
MARKASPLVKIAENGLEISQTPGDGAEAAPHK